MKKNLVLVTKQRSHYQRLHLVHGFLRPIEFVTIQDFRLPASRHNLIISTPQKYYLTSLRWYMLHTLISSIRIYRNTLYSGITQTGKLNLISSLLQFWNNLVSFKQHCNFRILTNISHTFFTTEIKVKFEKWRKSFAHWVFSSQAILCE